MQDLLQKYNTRYFEKFVSDNIRYGQKDGDIFKIRIKKKQLNEQISNLENVTLVDNEDTIQEKKKKIRRLKNMNLHYLLLDDKRKKKLKDGGRGIERNLSYFKQNSDSYRMVVPQSYHNLSQEIARDLIRGLSPDPQNDTHSNKVKQRVSKLLEGSPLKNNNKPFDMQKELGEGPDIVKNRGDMENKLVKLIRYSSGKINKIIMKDADPEAVKYSQRNLNIDEPPTFELISDNREKSYSRGPDRLLITSTYSRRSSPNISNVSNFANKIHNRLAHFQDVLVPSVKTRRSILNSLKKVVKINHNYGKMTHLLNNISKPVSNNAIIHNLSYVAF